MQYFFFNKRIFLCRSEAGDFTDTQHSRLISNSNTTRNISSDLKPSGIAWCLSNVSGFCRDTCKHHKITKIAVIAKVVNNAKIRN